jgi:hypothetical protein
MNAKAVRSDRRRREFYPLCVFKQKDHDMRTVISIDRVTHRDISGLDRYKGRYKGRYTGGTPGRRS